ncbi:hypothetical protein MAGR_29070 [Mycolicibacterium agri]|uniref:DUF4097 domain-containing protein n=1 Tax=Mycolicibacterium agri TaxID=36811 RepID=A0A7I9W2N5_MYCAG|nr:hypothetical protein MAGR_29070 [Mycolicibacterium agri]
MFRVLLVVAAVAVLLGAVVTLGAVAFGLSTFRVITDSKPLPAELRSLVVDTGKLPMAIRVSTDRAVTEPRADMRMVNSTRASDQPLNVSEGAAGTRISINAEPSSFLQWGRAGEIHVVLPPEVARRLTLTTQQENGVLMAQADVDELVARITNGSILLSGSARRMELHSVDGDIVTRNPATIVESFSATTANGDIEVDFKGAAPKTVTASTDDGDIRIGLPPRGPYLVNATTGDRDGTWVRVPRTSDPASAAAEITARSANGDVLIDEMR